MHVPLTVACLAPFTSAPELQLGYTVEGGAGSVARTLALPLVPTKFCQPVDVPADVFRMRWSQVAGPPFKLAARLGGEGALAAAPASLAALGFKLLPEVDAPASGDTSAACIFHCGARQVPCMVRVQRDAGGAVLTVATADAMASDGLRTEMQQLLGGA